ncbi:phosphoglycerate mutase-like protein [Ramaria rubella]|nr:phosphoglycerate mutase-like protein [Ramaria rubella]
MESNVNTVDSLPDESKNSLAEATEASKDSDGFRYAVISFIRHAQSTSNLYTGQRSMQNEDDELTPHGVAQAQELGEQWADVRIDKIYSSHTKRAVGTANAIAERNRSKPELVQSNKLREHDFGPRVRELIMRGDSNGAWRERTGLSHWERGTPPRNHCPHGGESLDDLVTRGIWQIISILMNDGVQLTTPLHELSPQYTPTRKVDELPDGIPHIVVVSHNIFLCELWEALQSWNKTTHQASEADYSNAQW